MIAGTILSAMARPYVAMGVGAALLAFLAFGGVQTWRLGNAQDALTIEKLAHSRDIAIWREGGIKATADALANARRIELEQTQITEGLSDDYQTRLAAFQRGLAGRVRGASGANPSSTGKADSPQLAYDPGVYFGPGADRGISESDAGICGVVTLRLIAARQWALEQSQIDRGN